MIKINFFIFCFFLLLVWNISYVLTKSGKKKKENLKCASLLDLVILLDASGSVGKNNWNNVIIPFVHEIINNLNIGENNVHTGLATYSHKTHIKWKLDDSLGQNLELLRDRVEKLKNEYATGTTYTGAALNIIGKKIIFGEGYREYAPKLLILITDGMANDNPNIASEELRKKGVIILVVGVGQAYDPQCRTIAGCKPKDVHCPLYKKANWSSLVGEVKSIIKTACETLPKDAICNEWSDWGQCSKTCGKGIQTRSVKEPITLSPAEMGDNKQMGRTCEELYPITEEAKECNLGECAIDAVCGNFGTWDLCTKECGGGTQKRHRSPFNNPAAKFGGKTCEQQNFQQTETRQCNTHPCAIDAVPAEWAEWGECSEPCGWGTRIRKRNKDIISAQYGGLTLEQQHIETEQSEPCKHVDCGPCVTNWGPWTKCSAEVCVDGIKSRHRAVKFDYPDKKCDEVTYETDECDVDCKDVIPPVTPEEEIDVEKQEQEQQEGEEQEGEKQEEENQEEGKQKEKKEKEETEEAGPANANNIGAIAGGIIGGIALLGVIGGAGYYFTSPSSSVSTPIESTEGGIEKLAEVEEQEVTVNVDAESEAWQ